MAQDLPAGPAVAKPALTIRSHLFLLAVCAVLPVLAFAFFVSVVLIDQRREAILTGSMDRARAMLTAVDAELRGSIRTLEALAKSPALESGDLKPFHAEMVRMRASQPTWRSVTLASKSSARQILNSERPFGAALPLLAELPSVERVFKTGLPEVGNVVVGPVLGVPLVPVRVPVMRNGAVSFMLLAAVEPESFENLILQQNLPEAAVMGIADGNGKFVARIPPRAAGSVPRASPAAAPHAGDRGPSFHGAPWESVYYAMRARPCGQFFCSSIDTIDQRAMNSTSSPAGPITQQLSPPS